MLDQIKTQKCSDGSCGWPVAVKDRIAHFSELDKLDKSNVAVTFLWTMRDSVIPKLNKGNLAIATNFYTPAGLVGMVRNILANPHIRYLVLFGEEYSSKSKDDQIALTSANAIRAFFEKGIDDKRKVPGFESSVHFDENIPTELIKRIIENVQLVDLNKQMPDAPIEEKIETANKLLENLEPKEPFLDKPFVFDYEETVESFPFEGGPVIVHGSSIPETWVDIIHNIYRYGRPNLMNADTDRYIKEINNMIAVIHDPQNMDLSINPFLVPLTEEKIEAYKKEILSPILPEGKAYTYGNKLRAYLFDSPKKIKDLVNSKDFKDFEFGQGPHVDANVKYSEDFCEINQVQDMIDVLKRDPYSKSCVAVTWHTADELMRKHKSSPCLVLLQPIVQDEKLNLFVFFRSHDMTQGWPENAYGCAAIQKEIADAIKIKPGILTIVSGSAQIYNHYYQQVEDMLKKYKKLDESYYDPRGNYTIEIKDKKIVVTHIHPDNNNSLETFEGTSALDIKAQIANKASIKTDHAIYLGIELAKAELALKKNLKYEQDKDLV